MFHDSLSANTQGIYVEEKLNGKFIVALVKSNEHIYCKQNDIIYKAEQEPAQRQFVIVTPTPWMRYDYNHVPSAEFNALLANAIVTLDTLSWTRPVYPNLV